MAVATNNDNPFHALLYDPNRQFWKQPDYSTKTIQELSSPTPLPALYEFETESKVWRVAKEILAVLLVLPFIYRCLHALVGKLILLSTKKQPEVDEVDRQGLFLLPKVNDMEVKRFTVNVNGAAVDAILTGSAQTLTNKRWILYSTGNAGKYEQHLGCHQLQMLCRMTNANFLTYNYPGVVASEGSPNAQACVDAHQAMISLLQDDKNGIGATEIIDYGESFGGGVQGHSLETLKLSNKKYIFLKDYTFSSLHAAIATNPHFNCFSAKCAAIIAWLFGWILKSTHASVALEYPEIIVQRMDAQQFNTHQASNPKMAITSDGTISAEASHAYGMLANQPQEGFKSPKIFIGSTNMHENRISFQAISRVSQYINHMFNDMHQDANRLKKGGWKPTIEFLNEPRKGVRRISKEHPEISSQHTVGRRHHRRKSR